MAKLHYLTVQDILWINLQATKKVQHFSYAKLEEATYYQYAYGESNELIGQAGRFLSGFLKMRPLEAGNEATALIGLATFLHMNGLRLTIDDASAAAWVRSSSVSTEAARDALLSATESEHDHHSPIRPDVRAAIRSVMERYPSTIATLLSSPVAA
jgi:prophage maintenance system killer protein